MLTRILPMKTSGMGYETCGVRTSAVSDGTHVALSQHLLSFLFFGIDRGRPGSWATESRKPEFTDHSTYLDNYTERPVSSVKPAFHDADTDILATIHARMSARISVSVSWNASLTQNATHATQPRYMYLRIQFNASLLGELRQGGNRP